MKWVWNLQGWTRSFEALHQYENERITRGGYAKRNGFPAAGTKKNLAPPLGRYEKKSGPP